MSVVLRDGTRIALEVQLTDIPDFEWQDRHDDYRHAGVTDIWFWDRRHRPRVVQLEHDTVPWAFDIDTDRIGIPIANGHVLTGHWWDWPAVDVVRHFPPCPADDVRICDRSLTEFGLTANGLDIPAPRRDELAHATKSAQRDLGFIRAARRQREQLEAELTALTARISARTERIRELGDALTLGS